MTKVILTGHILIATDELPAVMAELDNHKALTLAEEGCIAFEVTQAADNPNKFLVYEEFVNKQAFDAHQTRVKHSVWGRVSANVQRHYQVSYNSN